MHKTERNRRGCGRRHEPWEYFIVVGFPAILAVTGAPERGGRSPPPPPQSYLRLRLFPDAPAYSKNAINTSRATVNMVPSITPARSIPSAEGFSSMQIGNVLLAGERAALPYFRRSNNVFGDFYESPKLPFGVAPDRVNVFCCAYEY